MCQRLAQPVLRNSSCLLQNYQHFRMSKGNTKAQKMTSNISAESILITGESNWIQMKTVIWFVLFIWSTETNRINQMNQTNLTNQINRKGLVPATEVPSPGSKEPSRRLRVMAVMLVMVSQSSSAKTDQREETSAEQHTYYRLCHCVSRPICRHFTRTGRATIPT
jgi:hypothetical protein